ncbi:hypothetical protein [Parablautia sp. Marseille-Q6255]|uniref:hypothetical protein n=1 Tax=Parablautia sp. Marseille-Q6255 TaxID=3039593 RepID=UPI0024BD4936|nr:hypothetical protein [Parablautia sp. Marseille-Q6255]
MNGVIKTKAYKTGKCLVIYVDSKSKVNELMIDLMEAGFTVNYEPSYIEGNYEGCFLYGDENAIKICCKEGKRGG